MNNKELFTGKSDDYSRFRPSYPDAAVNFLYERCPKARAADVGAGTGIFTRCLLRRFNGVIAVEPNEDMRKKFSENLPDISCLAAAGEATGIADKSIDLITVAQAFHWLDEEKFKAEALRILRPNGKVAIIWNTSLKDDFTAARDAVCQKYCPRFRAGHAGKRSAAEGDHFLRNSYFKKVEVVSFPNPFTMDLEVYLGNMRSRSYALCPGDNDYEKFISGLRAVFEKFAVNGAVTEPQETRIYLGEFPDQETENY